MRTAREVQNRINESQAELDKLNEKNHAIAEALQEEIFILRWVLQDGRTK